MDIQIIDEPTRLVAVIRRAVPMAEIKAFYDSVYGDVTAALLAAGHAPAGAALGWMHHDEVPDSLDIAAGFPVEGIEIGALHGAAEGGAPESSAVGSSTVEVVSIPGGRALVTEYQGPYDGLHEAWQAIENLRAAEGLEARGDTVEEYLTEPAPGGDPELNRTRLVMMVL